MNPALAADEMIDANTTRTETRMYALMITFRSSIPVAQLADPFGQYAKQLREQPGLLTKAWIRDGDTLGGFHLFDSKQSADAYVASDLAAGLRATDGFDDFDVQGFDVLDDLSAMTGVSMSRPLAHQ